MATMRSRLRPAVISTSRFVSASGSHREVLEPMSTISRKDLFRDGGIGSFHHSQWDRIPSSSRA